LSLAEINGAEKATVKKKVKVKSKFITRHYSNLKVEYDARISNPSRNWYQLADPERIKGLVNPEHVVYTM
jgi:hypothetical protein